MDGKPGKTLLWFLRPEHLVQPNAKVFLEDTPAETRRRGDGSDVGAWLGKCEGSTRELSQHYHKTYAGRVGMRSGLLQHLILFPFLPALVLRGGGECDAPAHISG